jgi:hypothetical protein
MLPVDSSPLYRMMRAFEESDHTPRDYEDIFSFYAELYRDDDQLTIGDYLAFYDFATVQRKIDGATRRLKQHYLSEA